MALYKHNCSRMKGARRYKYICPMCGFKTTLRHLFVKHKNKCVYFQEGRKREFFDFPLETKKNRKDGKKVINHWH